MLTTSVCKYEDFDTDWYFHWTEAFGWEKKADNLPSSERWLHRKYWEWAAIAQALHERHLLMPGKTGCGFAVGREPLSSLFAARGVRVCATDLPVEAETPETATASTWAETGQHAASLEAMHAPNLIDIETFRRMVKFRPVDMRDLQLPWDEKFDFLWSSCSIEHLGSLEAGMSFVKNAMHLLKPGGIAVHTTEFNVGSNDDTMSVGQDVIYRRRDIEQLDYELRRIRCGLAKPDYFAGDHQYDIEYDPDPFNTPGNRKHIKLLIGSHVSTSLIMIIRKGSE